MNLFDIRTRNDLGPRKNVDSTFDFLNRSSRPEYVRIRKQFEEWFAAYPEAAKSDLYGRFRSPIEHAHEGAQFELLLHALLSRLTATSVAVSASTPDFFVPSAEIPFYVEATVVRLNADLLDDPPLEGAVFDAINELHSPNFFLFVDTAGTLSRAPAAAIFLKPLTEFIASHDPDAVTAITESGGPRPRIEIEFEGWRLEATLIPKSVGHRTAQARTIGGGPFRGGWANDFDGLREAIIAKAKKFRQPAAPYIVAVNGRGHHDRGDEIRALFGKEQPAVSLSKPSGIAQVTRDGNGVWINGAEARSSNVAAVLMCQNLAPWSLHSPSAHLYVNPYVQVALPQTLMRLPNTVAVGGELRFTEGMTPGEILGLDRDWLAA